MRFWFISCLSRPFHSYLFQSFRFSLFSFFFRLFHFLFISLNSLVFRLFFLFCSFLSYFDHLFHFYFSSSFISFFLQIFYSSFICFVFRSRLWLFSHFLQLLFLFFFFLFVAFHSFLWLVIFVFCSAFFFSLLIFSLSVSKSIWWTVRNKPFPVPYLFSISHNLRTSFQNEANQVLLNSWTNDGFLRKITKHSPRPFFISTT